MSGFRQCDVAVAAQRAARFVVETKRSQPCPYSHGPRWAEAKRRRLLASAAAAVVLLSGEHQKRRRDQELDTLLVLLLGAHEIIFDEPVRPREVYARPDYTQSAWARMLRAGGLHVQGSRAANNFRRDFRIPYVVFLELVGMVSDLEWFPSAVLDAPEDERRDVSGRMCIPLELKVRELLRCRATVSPSVRNKE